MGCRNSAPCPISPPPPILKERRGRIDAAIHRSRPLRPGRNDSRIALANIFGHHAAESTPQCERNRGCRGDPVDARSAFDKGRRGCHDGSGFIAAPVMFRSPKKIFAHPVTARYSVAKARGRRRVQAIAANASDDKRRMSGQSRAPAKLHRKRDPAAYRTASRDRRTIVGSVDATDQENSGAKSAPQQPGHQRPPRVLRQTIFRIGPGACLGHLPFLMPRMHVPWSGLRSSVRPEHWTVTFCSWRCPLPTCRSDLGSQIRAAGSPPHSNRWPQTGMLPPCPRQQKQPPAAEIAVNVVPQARSMAVIVMVKPRQCRRGW